MVKSCLNLLSKTGSSFSTEGMTKTVIGTVDGEASCQTGLSIIRELDW